MSEVCSMASIGCVETNICGRGNFFFLKSFYGHRQSVRWGCVCSIGNLSFMNDTGTGSIEDRRTLLLLQLITVNKWCVEGSLVPGIFLHLIYLCFRRMFIETAFWVATDLQVLVQYICIILGTSLSRFLSYFCIVQ